MTKEELYKVSDILNDVLSNYLRGSETEEVLSRFEESISNSDMLQEKYNITGIKSRHATGKLKECIDNQTEERLEQTRKQLEENPQECMYARDNYTDEDRKVLCDGCEEECEYAQKEADWLQELHCKLDSLSKEDFEEVWAKYHQKEEPVSEDFETALEKKVREAQDWTYIEEEGGECPLNEEFGADDLEEFARWGANWQKEQFEKNRLKHCNSITNEQAELTDEIKLWFKQWSENEMEWSREDIWDTAEHFAEWQKQQMMRRATDGQIEIGEDYLRIKCLCMSCPPQYDGKLVKLIIIKED